MAGLPIVQHRRALETRLSVWAVEGRRSNAVLVVGKAHLVLLLLMGGGAAVEASVTATATTTSTIDTSTRGVETGNLRILDRAALLGGVVNVRPLPLLTDQLRAVVCGLDAPEKQWTAGLRFIQDGRVPEFGDQAFEALSVCIRHSARSQMFPAHVVWQKIATPSTDESKQRPHASEVDKGITDRLILLEVNAVVRKVKLARDSCLKHIDKVCTSHLRWDIADHQRGANVLAAQDSEFTDILWLG